MSSGLSRLTARTLEQQNRGHVVTQTKFMTVYMPFVSCAYNAHMVRKNAYTLLKSITPKMCNRFVMVA